LKKRIASAYTWLTQDGIFGLANTPYRAFRADDRIADHAEPPRYWQRRRFRTRRLPNPRRRVRMPTTGAASNAAGVISLILLTVSVVLGVAVSQRRTLPRAVRYPSRRLHEQVSLAALGFLAVHILLSGVGSTSWSELITVFVPFGDRFFDLWLNLGVIASDLLIAVVVTSVLRRRIGRRAWLAVHWLSYACWPAAEAHSLGVGAGLRFGQLFDLALGCAVAVIAAVIWRLTGRWREIRQRASAV
jgi:sulfoxide reductase heme-binding subunit YedZ